MWKHVLIYIDMIDTVMQRKCSEVLYVTLVLPPCPSLAMLLDSRFHFYVSRDCSSKSPRVQGINMQPSSHGIQLLPEGDTSTVVATQSHPSFYLHGIGDTSMTQQTPGTCSVALEWGTQQSAGRVIQKTLTVPEIFHLYSPNKHI